MQRVKAIVGEGAGLLLGIPLIVLVIGIVLITTIGAKIENRHG